jgi:hypothetical protein
LAQVWLPPVPSGQSQRPTQPSGQPQTHALSFPSTQVMVPAAPVEQVHSVSDPFGEQSGQTQAVRLPLWQVWDPGNPLGHSQ